MFAVEKVIVYRNQTEQRYDEWLWQGDGMIYLACVGVAIVLGLLIFAAVQYFGGEK